MRRGYVRAQHRWPHDERPLVAVTLSRGKWWHTSLPSHLNFSPFAQTPGEQLRNAKPQPCAPSPGDTRSVSRIGDWSLLNSFGEGQAFLPASTSSTSFTLSPTRNPPVSRAALYVMSQ